MRLSVLIGSVSVALAGCVSVLPEPQTPEALYRISASGPPRSIAKTVIVREPEAPQIMSGRAMMREDDAGAIRLVPGIEWSGRATRLIQLAIVDSFGIGEGGAVLPESAVGGDYELSIRLTMLGFEGQRAVCSGTASLIESRSRDIVAQDRVTVSLDGAAAAPATLKAAGEACVNEFAAFVANALKQTNEY